MAFFRIRKSIVGRLFGLTATGGLAITPSTGSTDFDAVAVMRDSTGARLSPFYEPITTASSSGALISNNGLTILSSASATARTFSISAPVAGVLKEIMSISSASAVTVETTAATILFYTTGGATSSALTFGAASIRGEAVVLRGLSTTQWAVLQKTGGVT